MIFNLIEYTFKVHPLLGLLIVCAPLGILFYLPIKFLTFLGLSQEFSILLLLALTVLIVWKVFVTREDKN